MTTNGTNPGTASRETHADRTARRFCLAPAFARLIKRERLAIPVVEGHFPDQSERRSYVRMEGDHCLLVLEDRNASGVPEEERSEVSRAQGEVLLDVCAGKTTFERINLEAANGVAIHVDRFTSPVSACFVEASFADPAAAEAFRPPIWFGAELDADDVGDARRIALGGKPKLFEGAIQNAAIEALLDLLDQRVARYGAYRGGDDHMMSALRRLVAQPGDENEGKRSTHPGLVTKTGVEFMMIVDDEGENNSKKAPVAGVTRTRGEQATKTIT